MVVDAASGAFYADEKEPAKQMLNGPNAFHLKIQPIVQYRHTKLLQYNVFQLR